MVPSKAEQQPAFRDCSPVKKSLHRSLTQSLSSWQPSPGILGGTQRVPSDPHWRAASAAAGTECSGEPSVATCMTAGQDCFPAKSKAGIHVSNAATYPAPPKGDSRDNNKTPLRDGDAHISYQRLCSFHLSLLFPSCFHSAISYFGGCGLSLNLPYHTSPCPLFVPWHGDDLCMDGAMKVTALDWNKRIGGSTRSPHKLCCP